MRRDAHGGPRVRTPAQVLALAAVLVLTAVGCDPPAARSSATARDPATARSPLLFDGRAVRMNRLRCDPTACGQEPALWSGTQFCGDDIALQTDRRFGRVYRYRTDAQSNLSGCHVGSIWSPSVAYASLNHLPNYQVLGTVEFYGESIMLPKGFTFISPGWESLMQYGFGPYNGAEQLMLSQDFGATHFELSLDGGQVVNCAGPKLWKRGNMLDLGSAARLEGRWVDFIVGIDWRTDNTGWVDVYMRVPGFGQRTFKRKYHITGRPTYQWGTCNGSEISSRGTRPGGARAPYMDQQNDYEGYWDQRPLSRFPSHTFIRSGVVIASDLAAVEAASAVPRTPSNG